MTHPIHELTTANGEIFHISGVTRVPYLNSPAIRISGKLGYEQLSVTEYRFRFVLNSNPCDVWQAILRNELQDFQVQIEHDIVNLVCIPANIESRLEKLKTAIAKTNQRYEATRQSTTKKIEEQRKQSAIEAKTARQTSEQVKKIFDDLKL
jgi:hypothetical protein